MKQRHRALLLWQASRSMSIKRQEKNDFVQYGRLSGVSKEDEATFMLIRLAHLTEQKRCKNFDAGIIVTKRLREMASLVA